MVGMAVGTEHASVIPVVIYIEDCNLIPTILASPALLMEVVGGALE